jgi:hypothetical protein
VKPSDWGKYFDETFSRKINDGVVYETQLLASQYKEELESDFRKEETRENTLNREITKPQDHVGYRPRSERCCTERGGGEESKFY